MVTGLYVRGFALDSSGCDPVINCSWRLFKWILQSLRRTHATVLTVPVLNNVQLWQCCALEGSREEAGGVVAEPVPYRPMSAPPLPDATPNHLNNGSMGREARLLAIAGCTNSGKTTMARAFCKMFAEEGLKVAHVQQDDFFYPKEKVAVLKSKCGKRIFYDYDSVQSVDVVGLCKRVTEASVGVDYVLVEGNMLTEMASLMDMVDRVVFLTINQSTCKRRREKRNYDPPDESGYFDEVVWPSYTRHLMNALAIAREDSRMTFLDVSRENDNNEEQHMNELMEALSDDVVRITFDPLDIAEASTMVSSPSCGGTSFFVGTTRDTFDGRKVLRLEYESYDEMAYKEMRKLCRSIRRLYPTVERVVVFHRIGEVAVGEVSVIIGTASPHRTEAIRATEWAIDELKRTVPIWKKEAYEDGGAAWKENADWQGRQPPLEAAAQAPLTPPPNHDEKSFADAKTTRENSRKETADGGTATGSGAMVEGESRKTVLAASDGTAHGRVDVRAKEGWRQSRDHEGRIRPSFWH